jgi:hypothetical protein
VGEQPREMLRGAVSSLSPCPDPQSGRVRALPDPALHAATAGFRRTVMRVIWKSSRQTVEASTPCSAHPDFERTLHGRPKYYDLRVTTTSGLVPAAAITIRRSPDVVCGP